MRPPRWIALALVAATCAVYLQVREHEFVGYDDAIYITENPNLPGGLSQESLWGAFASPYEVNWIPLTWISFQIDYALYGFETAGYLLTNVAFHTGSALLLFFALLRMTGAVWQSAFVAGVFALHPMHVESVAWASERKDALSALFWMLALLAYARYAERPTSLARYGLVAACLALGLLAKPMLVTLPFTLLLLDHWPLGRLRDARGRWNRRALLEKLPLLALAGAVATVTFVIQRQEGAMFLELSLPLRLMNALDSYVWYVAKSFWPTGLCVFYPYAADSLSPGRAALAGGVLLAATAGALRLVRTRPYLATGWLWYLGTLLPVIGLVQVGAQARADRYMYVPMIGLSIAVAWGVPELLRRGSKRRIAFAAAASGALAALAASAWVQASYWRDTMALYGRAVAVTEGNAFAHQELAQALYGAGRMEEARWHFRESLRIEPRGARAHRGLADLLATEGELEKAIAHYRLAALLDPHDVANTASLGLALLRVGRAEEAHSGVERSLRLHQDTPSLHAAMALISAALGRMEAAVRHNRAALRLDPDLLAAANNLAWILATHEDAALRDPDEAIRLVEAAALASEPPDAGLLDTLAASYAAAGRFEEAAELASRAAGLARQRGEEERSEAMGARVALYRARRAYVEPRPGPVE